MRDYDDYKLDSGQEDKIFGECAQCGEIIYRGEEYIRLGYNGEYLHSDGECYEEYAEDFLKPRFKVAGE